MLLSKRFKGMILPAAGETISFGCPLCELSLKRATDGPGSKLSDMNGPFVLQSPITLTIMSIFEIDLGKVFRETLQIDTSLCYVTEALHQFTATCGGLALMQRAQRPQFLFWSDCTCKSRTHISAVHGLEPTHLIKPRNCME